MKLVCNRTKLLETLDAAITVVPSRGKPLLQCVELRASEDRLTISATDLEMSLRCACFDAQVETVGTVVIPANLLRDIVRECSVEVVSMELHGNYLYINSSNSRFKIFTEREAFPVLSSFNGKIDFEILGSDLKRMIRQTIFAVAREATRHCFNGVLMVAEGRKLKMTSSDGRRLALVEGDLIASGGKKKAIIPGRALTIAEKVLDDEQSVRVQIGDYAAVFYTPDATITCNLCAGEFPPYEDVIPKTNVAKMIAPTSDFLSAIRQAKLLATSERSGVRFNFSKTGLVLSARNPEAGESRVELPCKFEGEEIEIGFNPDFLVDALTAADTDDVTFQLNIARSGLLRCGPNFSYVVMNVNT